LADTHEKLAKALSTKPISSADLENRMLTLTDDLDRARDDNALLQRTIEQGVIGSKIREKKISEMEKKAANLEGAAAYFAQATIARFGELPSSTSLGELVAKWDEAFKAEFERTEEEIQRARSLESDLKATTSRVADLAKEKTTLEGLLATSKAEALRYQAMLSGISDSIGARCAFDDLPLAVARVRDSLRMAETEVQRQEKALENARERYKGGEAAGQKMKHALDEAIAERDEALEKLSEWETKGQVIASDVKRLEKRHRWLIATTALTFGLIATGWLYSWGGPPKQLPVGGELSQSLQGGSR
jgi:YesN/AraC family two-component response regulator